MSRRFTQACRPYAEETSKVSKQVGRHLEVRNQYYSAAACLLHNFDEQGLTCDAKVSNPAGTEVSPGFGRDANPKKEAPTQNP